MHLLLNKRTYLMFKTLALFDMDKCCFNSCLEMYFYYLFFVIIILFFKNNLLVCPKK